MVPSPSSASFDAFVHTRTPALARTAYLLTGDAHLAEDLVQTALFKAARDWPRIEAAPEAYVRRILYTQNVSWWRRRRIAESPLEGYDEQPAPPSGGASDSDLRLSLEAALARLTTRQRTVLVRSELDNRDGVLRAGTTGYAKIYCGERRLGGLILRRGVRSVRTEFWSLW